jgi:hypothetical protein
LDVGIADFASLPGDFFDFVAQNAVEDALTHANSFGLQAMIHLNYSLNMGLSMAGVLDVMGAKQRNAHVYWGTDNRQVCIAGRIFRQTTR